MYVRELQVTVRVDIYLSVRIVIQGSQGLAQK